MESPHRVERKVSFNPEAAAFSPTTMAAKQAEDLAASTGSAEHVSPGFGISATPRRNYVESSLRHVTYQDPEDSPFGSKAKGKPLVRHGEASSASPAPLQLQDLLDKGIPREALMRTLGDSPTTPTKGMTSSHQAPYQQTPNFAMYSQYRPEPNFVVPDMDELSASLGLPGAKKIPTVNESPAHAQTPREMTDGFYSKLLNRAQDKPLTADSLAHMLQSRSDSSGETIRAPRQTQDPFVLQGSPAQELGQTMKVVRPPPGFGNQTPRMVKVEDEQVPAGPSTIHQTPQYPVQAGYYQPPQSSVGQSSTPFQPHARHPSTRRRPRGQTRTKRTDQGPEPSAADIYPDDANWMPSATIHRNYFAPPPPQVQQQQQIQDAMSWPTPAEVHQPRALPQAASQAAAQAHAYAYQKPFDLFENHTPPSIEDKNASDEEVLSLLDQLPERTIDTLIEFGALDLLGDERPLTPQQNIGTRYGLEFYGIGLWDYWGPPAAANAGSWEKPEPFRVRPRDHEDWGGWDWGMKKGWGGE